MINRRQKRIKSIKNRSCKKTRSLSKLKKGVEAMVPKNRKEFNIKLKEIIKECEG